MGAAIEIYPEGLHTKRTTIATFQMSLKVVEFPGHLVLEYSIAFETLGGMGTGLMFLQSFEVLEGHTALVTMSITMLGEVSLESEGLAAVAASVGIGGVGHLEDFVLLIE